MKKVKSILLGALLMTLLVGGVIKLMDESYVWTLNSYNETVQL